MLTEANEKEFADEEEIICIGTEHACVGAGIGGGFENTNELRVMKYKEAMATDEKEEWDESANKEHDRMVEKNAWKAVPKKDVPKGAKVITSTWAMKKKANGDKIARIKARGFEQVDGEHYDKSTMAAPVTNDATIRIVLILMLMAAWYGKLLDVMGAFLHGQFWDGEEIYMEVPEGFQKFYPQNVLLLLLRTIYGLKQAAYAFWIEILKCFRHMGYERSKADPCLYWKWKDDDLIIWLSWIDDCLCLERRVMYWKQRKR